MGLFELIEFDGQLEQVLGYLNFSTGSEDIQFLKNLEGFEIEIGGLPARAV